MKTALFSDSSDWPAGFQMQLVRRLAAGSSIKQFLKRLHKESCKEFKIKALVLCWQSGHFGPCFYVCSKDGFYKRGLSKLNPRPLKAVEWADKQTAARMAEELGRPVQNILTVPLDLKQYSLNQPAELLVECFVKNQKIKLFYECFLQIITSFLDRLLLEDHLQTGSNLLYSAFNQLKEPLAVVDQNAQVSSSNKMFDAIWEEDKKTKKSLLPLPVLNEPACPKAAVHKPEFNQPAAHKPEFNQQLNRVYEKHCYPACINGSMFTVYHYADVTESLELRSRMIQNEKMSALGQWGESLAHKLNNPLTGILSMAQVLLFADGLDSQNKADMKDIAAAAKRSQKIISQLLAFSHSGKELYWCNLNTAVKDTLPLLKSITGFAAFELQLCRAPVFVKAELCLLQQVIFNLVKNACQAAGGGKGGNKGSGGRARPKVRVCVTRENNLAILRVEDSGPGVKKENLDQIFKPFFTTKTKQEGTGLGLSVSRSIVQSFNGRLRAAGSGLGGACFSLSLKTQPINDKREYEDIGCG